ncbi:hypothetical protein NQ315_013720 [Exocentrus adspersus]|uniref:Uncharacterized protein n=1 Tax=Exocentrus adspersus TaxID=1586481 RepID=A0AAV8W3K1_9CUCU|nr:hypothetical protein NQ315_013720 [Exocentrus adspersus]
MSAPSNRAISPATGCSDVRIDFQTAVPMLGTLWPCNNCQLEKSIKLWVFLFRTVSVPICVAVFKICKIIYKVQVLRTEPGNVPLDNVAEGYLILLVKLGVEEELSENTFKDIEKFVIHLYSTNDNVNSINSLRGILAASRPINKLPPTLDSLRQHCLRAHYQAKIWLNSNIPQQEIMLPSYERSGWKIEEGKLVAVLLTQPAFPEDTSVLSTCNCKKRRKGIKKSLYNIHTCSESVP